MALFSNWFFWVFVAFYAAYLLVEISLDILNMRYANAHKNSIPSLFAGIYSMADYHKSIEYSEAKTRFKIFGLVIKTIFIFILIFTGFFGWLDNFLAISYKFGFLARGYLSFCCGAHIFSFCATAILLLPVCSGRAFWL